MRRAIKITGAVGAIAAVATAIAVANTPATAEPAAAGSPKVKIRYTEYGIPHITARDYGGLGEGLGFASAKDNVCLLADSYLTVSGQRSRYLGPNAPVSPGLGGSTTSLNSDLHFQRINDSRVVERLVDQPAPNGPEPRVRDVVRGYAKGYNKYLAEHGGAITDPRCKGQEWVRPITDLDVYRHVYSVVVGAGSGGSVDGEVNAQPPATPVSAPAPDTARRLSAALGAGKGPADIGSNAIAVGSQGVTDGRSVLLGNPHFPWHGSRRFWQSHLTIPGEIDVSGAGLIGMPAINIGHTDRVAWSHTVSTVIPFGLFEVPLTPGKPTQYLVDGKPEDMTSQRVAVQVRNDDGSIGTVERTLWSTRYGPVTNEVEGIDLPWGQTAHVMRDANAGNLRALNTWFGFAKARDTAGLRDVLRRGQGIPWVNTIASDRDGNALYTDSQVVPHVTDEHAATCGTPLGKETFASDGLSILDGGRSACQWGTDGEALEPGLLGPSRMPSLTRKDFVTNANDSPWLANPARPLSYPRVFGDTLEQRSTRTQESIIATQRRITGTDGLPGRGFSNESMRAVLFSDHSRNAELTAADTAKMCAAFPDGKAPSSSGPVDVRAACPALASWQHGYTNDSRGSLLFQRFWAQLGRVPGGPWKVPFDPRNPVHTPNTLAADKPEVALAFGNAAAEVLAAGLALDAPLAQGQTVTRNGERIPIHGGPGQLGVLNVITATWDPKRGYVEVPHGSSYIQVIQFGRGAPKVSTVLTYSQSSDPTSPHFSDQTKLYSSGGWVTPRFTDAEIDASPALTTTVLD
ncbi:acyl-homoserine-lactone acylase [Herbihabitans rhizosphaerae]|uniref:Acyl-homoserine-lactone acylase n=1 Tax=Herbihabitans rhizosphaerae TaxID=1872711 RepID=A0A4Q7KJU7_9PSEU|nr:penicillin acylase family protein [Herbihabitans rhizosphaerae]RZS36858.1 acyl-homoserine-lactone acylase [Herbihabitans rhizosphaerae]